MISHKSHSRDGLTRAKDINILKLLKYLGLHSTADGVMEPEANVCKTALDIIRSANLTPTEHLILEKFLDEAVDPSYAARYLLQRLNENPGRDTEAGLRVFKQDWKRLVSKCEPLGIS